MAEKLVFDSAIEGLFLRGLGEKITPGLRAELLTLGIDLTKKLPPAVTREQWYSALNAAARHCYPALDRAEALRTVGVVLMKGVEETFFGRAMAPMVRLLGPRRLLERVPKNMKSSNNFADGVVVALADRKVQLDTNDVGDAPEVFQGSLQEMAAWAGARDVKVTYEFSRPPAARFIIEWAEG